MMPDEKDDIPSAALDAILKELQTRKFGEKTGAASGKKKDTPVAMEVSVTKAAPMKGKGLPTKPDGEEEDDSEEDSAGAPAGPDPKAIASRMSFLRPKR